MELTAANVAKSQEQLRKEMLERLKSYEGQAQYFNEVAMPGIAVPVNPDDMKE